MYQYIRNDIWTAPSRNPMDKGMIKAITTAETLAGRNEYCMNYLSALRGGLLAG
jgi:hypothetical protein